MITVRSCVVCDSEIRRRRRARVASFVARRVWNRPSFHVDLVECSSCEFLFYNPRLEPEEEGRLYAGYRSEEYQQMRRSFEPWYTPELNHRLGLSVVSEGRRRTLVSILRKHLPQQRIERVLDYGGYRGELVRGLIEGAQAFVYDIADVPPVEGVTAVSDPSKCRADIIINSNVLEHAGFPRLVVAEMLKAATVGTAVHVEVPCESPFGVGRMIRRVAQAGVTALTRPALARTAVSPSSLFLMHEHVNYFSDQSLAALIRSCGCSVIATGMYGWDGTPGKSEILWCLGVVTRVPVQA